MPEFMSCSSWSSTTPSLVELLTRDSGEMGDVAKLLLLLDARAAGLSESIQNLVALILQNLKWN